MVSRERKKPKRSFLGFWVDWVGYDRRFDSLLTIAVIQFGDRSHDVAGVESLSISNINNRQSRFAPIQPIL
jgi:hypothetical protein